MFKLNTDTRKVILDRKMKYKLILLKPEYQTVVERCQMRTCHTSITTKKWIKHFTICWFLIMIDLTL